MATLEEILGGNWRQVLVDLFNAQEVFEDEITNLVSNLKKLKITERTEPRLSNKWESIFQKWCEFNKIHQTLLKTDQTGQYFDRDVYKLVQEKVKEAQGFIRALFPDMIPEDLESIDPQPYLEKAEKDKQRKKQDDNGSGTESDESDESKKKRENEKKKKKKKQDDHGSGAESDEYDEHRKKTDKETNNSLSECLKMMTELMATNLTANRQFLAETIENMQGSGPNATGKNEIPVFDGRRIKDYKNFKLLFESIIGKRTKMAAIQKFAILRTKLDGDAKKLIKHLQISDENYEHAWSLLKNRYEDARLMMGEDFEVLSTLPYTKAQDCESIKNFVDTIRESVYNLEVMGYDTVIGGPPLVHQIIKKMDPTTRLKFEEKVEDKTAFPTLTMVITFLDELYRNLKSIQRRQQHYEFGQKRYNTHLTLKDESSADPEEIECFICKDKHKTIKCPELKSSNDKAALLIKYKICIYCASHRYNRSGCRIKDRLSCGICKRQHVTAVHNVKNENSNNITTNFTEHHTETSVSEVLLPTAIATINNKHGTELKVRALIDQCSQANYVTEDTVQKLGLRKLKTSANIITIGGDISKTTKKLALFRLVLNDQPITVKAFVIKKITNQLPKVYQPITLKEEKELADPTYNKPGSIHILLGANVAADLFLPGVKKEGQYLLQSTKLGWIVSGPGQAGIQSKNKIVSCLTLNDAEWDEKLTAFWDIPSHKPDTDEIEYCENLYKTKHYRESDGRYVVPIMWKPETTHLGGSYYKALNFFLSQEKRMDCNKEHRHMFNEFMREYLEMDHMEPVPVTDHCNNTRETYYIPYFSVIRQEALTTKLRNVFNASAKTDNGVSLNELIYAGPSLQTKLFNVLISVRQYKYMFGADITKMYRQILIPPKDQDKLRILWRPSSSEPLQEFRLKTITYGVDCAPYQAIRTLHQVAEDEGKDEVTKDLIKNSFYMDDLLTGADTVKEAQQQIQKILTTLNAGKLPLTKWITNNPEILKDIDSKDIIETSGLLAGNSKNLKTLGLRYFPNTDSFGLNIKNPENIVYTKRGLLSAASTIFDPLGFLLPIVMKLRIMLQQLWASGQDWDSPVDEKTKNDFEQNLNNLAILQSIRVNRWIGEEAEEIKLVGFSDASADGYAAVIYAITGTNNKRTLVAAKGKITPLKIKTKEKDPQLTIPKLELEGILLLTELFKEVKNIFNNRKLQFIGYTDSMVALSWVRQETQNANAVVRRRVNKIKAIIQPNQLHHVSTKENPADAGSRGETLIKFMENKLWFQGPDWLSEKKLPVTEIRGPTETELITNVILQENYNEIPDRFSNYDNMIRVLTWCLRWKTKERGPLAQEELEATENQLIRQQQKAGLGKDIKLDKSFEIPNKHWLSKLSPFLDESGVLRVGGRLENASLEYNRKHPIILTKTMGITKMIVSKAHHHFKHAGPLLMATILGEKYWIPGVNNIIKREYRQCIKCLKLKARTAEQRMGDLPAERVNSAPIFAHTGVDLAGPFHLKASRLRTATTIKHWVAIFICLTTKLVHLELIVDLSTKAFLEGFTRFTARRGLPETIFSDNGSNLRGADRVLKEKWETITTSSAPETAKRGIKWKFIPSLSPHCGGIWESAVRTFKYFLKRTNNTTNIVYDEFYTIICSIEAIMNSRPLCELPNGSALTPAHFAIQRTLLFPPTPSDPAATQPVTKRWNQLQNILLVFWDKFRNEYLNTLQNKRKWTNEHPNLKVDDLVVLKEPGAPIDKWKLGRIKEAIPDKKGFVRQVLLKTGTGTMVHRAVQNLVPLTPLNNVEADKEEPVIQTTINRRTKSKGKLNLLSSTVLLLTLLQLAKGSVIPLYQTINVLNLRNVTLKAIDITFTVQTPLNLTNDMASLHAQSNAVDELCQQYTGMQPIKRRCTQITNALRLDVEAAIAHLSQKLDKSPADPRPKRWVVPVVLGLSQVVTMISMGAMYLNLKSENTDLRRKITKMSTILLNATEVEFDNLETKLNEVIETQNTLQLLGELENLNELATGLVQNIIEQYDQLDSLNPTRELDNYIKDLQTTIPNVERPHIPWQQLFKPVKKFVDNDLVFVTFNIPLMEKERYTEYLIALDPGAVNYTLSNGKLTNRVITNVANDTLVELHGVNENPYIENFIKRKINFCELNLLQQKSPKCPPRKTLKWTNGIDMIQDHQVAFYKREDQYNASSTCEGSSANIPKGLFLINLENCTLETEDFLLEGSLLETNNFILKEAFERRLNNTKDNWKKDLMIVSPVAEHNEELQKASKYINNMLNEEDNNWKDSWNNIKNWFDSQGSYTILGLIALCLLILGIIKCTRSKKPEPFFSRKEPVDENTTNIEIAIRSNSPVESRKPGRYSAHLFETSN